MPKPIHTVGVIIQQGDKVLMVKHGRIGSHPIGSYGFPAGRPENNETDQQAAVRELKEETGLDAIESDLIDYPNNLYTDKIERRGEGLKLYDFRVFLCFRHTGELTASAETSPEWVDLEKSKDLPLLPNILKIYHDVMKFKETL